MSAIGHVSYNAHGARKISIRTVVAGDGGHLLVHLLFQGLWVGGADMHVEYV